MTQQQQARVTLVVRVYPAGTPGQVLIEVVQQGPVYLTGPEIARTLRSAAQNAGGAMMVRHRFLADVAGTCLADVDGAACGQPSDAPIHDDGSWPAREPLQGPVQQHPYMSGSADWCLRLVDGRVCGLPWDDPVHGLEGWGIRKQEPPR
jgi:hypothetical protein